MPLLRYERWVNFEKAIKRAMCSCEASGIDILDHFRELTKMVLMGSGSKRNIKDYNSTAREMLGQRGIKPEDLPASEDIKKLECRVKSQEKKMASQSPKLPKYN